MVSLGKSACYRVFVALLLLFKACEGFHGGIPASSTQKSTKILTSSRLQKTACFISYDDWELTEEERRRDRDHRRQLREESMLSSREAREEENGYLFPIVMFLNLGFLAYVLFFLVYVPALFEKYYDETFAAVLKAVILKQ